jgi:hypothetical protein
MNTNPEGTEKINAETHQKKASQGFALLSETERSRVMASMSDNFEIQEDPRVGIFWYDAQEDELFGVTSTIASELPFNANGKKTVGTLHKTWWKKHQERAKAKGQLTSKFMKDYTQTPRGRIFQIEDGHFELMCGSWINAHITSLVKDEFNLHTGPLEVIVDEHWEIGHGWSEEF